MSETNADERARLRLTARQRLTAWGHISRMLDDKETFDMRPEWAAQIEELTKERDGARLAVLAERARAERLAEALRLFLALDPTFESATDDELRDIAGRKYYPSQKLAQAVIAARAALADPTPAPR